MPELLRGRYELLETLGQGGEGRVVKALDHQHQRLVALKVRVVFDSTDRDDLLSEARLLLELAPHSALPTVRDDFFEGGEYFIAMDYVDGVDLGTLLRTRGSPGLAWSSVLAYLADAAEALSHLHSQHPSVLHGDVKPGNLILTRGGRIKLVDFGMSSIRTTRRRRAGTPGFRAPELVGGAAPSPASDIYSLAATAFALLTGSAPSGVLPDWNGFTESEAAALEGALRRGLATNPERRPRSAGELVERLRAGWAESLPSGVTTFCMSDIEGSTALWDAQPEAMAGALVRQDEIVADIVDAHGGRVLKSMGEGDSTVSVFTSAPQAAAAAIAVSAALDAEPMEEGLQLRVRFGLHTGEAERRGADYYGAALNLAARIRGQADGGEVLCSTTTSELIGGRLPDGYELVDLGVHRLRGIQKPERLFAISGPEVRAPYSATDCPYPGMLAFDVDDRDIFFGREAVVATMLERLCDRRLLALVGASGSGKSSVLRAGVLAAVRAGDVSEWSEGWITTPGTATEDPIRPTGSLLIVDQFEELFTSCDDPVRRASYINSILSHDGPTVIGLRADFYGRLSAHPQLANAVVANQILLGPMDEEDLRTAITAPAARAGLRLEAGLVDLVVRDLAGEPGSLPLLSHALRATWELRDGRTLSIAAYRETGGVQAAIATTADHVLDATPPERRPLIRSVFLRLTELGDGVEQTRRRVAVHDLCTDTTQAQLDALLGELAGARLVTLDNGTVEVAHEALIREWPTLRRWIDEDREGLHLHRRLGEAAQQWNTAGRVPSDLYRGARLDAAREWSAANPSLLNATEQAFLDAATDEQRREYESLQAQAAAQSRANRRLRRRLAIAALALLVALGTTVVAVSQRNRAGHERDAANASARAAALRSVVDSSAALRSTKRDLAALLAVEAYRLDPSPASEGALLRTFTGSPGYEGSVPVPGGTSIVGELLPDGHTYAAVDGRVGVHLIDLETGASDAEFPPLHKAPDADVVVDLSRDGRYLALASDGPNDPNLLTEWDLKRHVRRFPDLRLESVVGAIAFSPDGSLLAVGGSLDAHVDIRSAVDGALLRTVPGLPRPADAHLRGYTAAVRFLGNGELAVGSQSGVVRIVDPATGQEVRRMAGPEETSEIQLQITSDGRQLVSEGYQGTEAWDLSSGRPLWVRPAPGRCEQIAIATAIDSVLCATDDSRVQAFDLATGGVTTNRFDYQLGIVSGINVSGDGDLLVEVGGPSLGLWRLDGSGPITKRILHGTGVVPQEFVTPNELLVGDVNPATGGAINPRLVDARTGAVIDSLRGVALATTTPVSGRLLALLPDGSTGLYDLATHQLVRSTRSRAPFVPDNTAKSDHALYASHGGEMRAINLRTGALLPMLVREKAPIFGIDVDPTGAHLLTGEDGSALQPRTSTGLRSGEPIPGTVAAVGTQLTVVASEAGTMTVLNSATYAPQGPPIPPITGLVDQLVIAHDQVRMLVVGRDGSIRIADLSSRQYIGDALNFGSATVGPVAFRADGDSLAFASANGIVVWTIDPTTMLRAACRVASRDITAEEWRTYFADLGPYRHAC